MVLKNLNKHLIRISSWPVIITLFILAHAVLLTMMAYTFPRINAQFATEAFDLKTFGYSVSEATSMLQNLDQATISFYLFPQLFLLDIIYPILLALFLSAVIIRLSILIKLSPKHIFSSLYLLPFLAMICDYLENIMISVMICNASDISTGIIKAASTLTLMKGFFTTLSWLIILALLGVWIYQKWQSRKKRDQSSDS